MLCTHHLKSTYVSLSARSSVAVSLATNWNTPRTPSPTLYSAKQTHIDSKALPEKHVAPNLSRSVQYSFSSLRVNLVSISFNRSSPLASQRSGRNASGSGNIMGSRCAVHAEMDTAVLPGIVWPSISVPSCGVQRTRSVATGESGA